MRQEDCLLQHCLKAFKYDGKLLVEKNDGAIPIADRGEILLEGESSVYLYFSIVDSKRNKEIEVRSLRKGGF